MNRTRRAGPVSASARGRARSAAPSWATYRQAIGDRSGLFAALMEPWAPARALYPGSYLDLSPSTAIPSVTYVDTDRRAARFFADHTLVADELEGRTRPGAGAEIRFLQADYTAAPRRQVPRRQQRFAQLPGDQPTGLSRPELIRSQGRGIGYTRTAFAYLFRTAGHR